MDLRQQMTYSYLVAAAGVALMAITAAYGAVRGILIREMLRPGEGSAGNFTGNFTRTFAGSRQFANASPFGLTSVLTIVAVIIAILGLAWLGLALRKSNKRSPK